jgi:hypothetical protein
MVQLSAMLSLLATASLVACAPAAAPAPTAAPNLAKRCVNQNLLIAPILPPIQAIHQAIP